MRVKNSDLVIGAVLTAIGSFLVVVAQENILGMVLLFVSNIFLIWYAVCTVAEFCRSLAKTTDENAQE